MVCLGHRKGPRTSEIIGKLGCTYFGITPQELASEIEWQEYFENTFDTIGPVHMDESGRVFVIFSSPDKKGQRYYLDEDELRKLGSKFRSYNNEKKETLQV